MLPMTTHINSIFIVFRKKIMVNIMYYADSRRRRDVKQADAIDCDARI